MHSGLLQTDKRVISFLLIIIAGLVVSSCSYSYFNKYFNQKRYFRLAENQLAKEHDIDSEFQVVDTAALSETLKFYYDRVRDKHVKLTRDHPDSRFIQPSFYKLVRTYYRLNKWAEVVKTAREYTAKFPSGRYLSLILYYKGLGYLHQGYEDLAMEIFASIDDVEMAGSYAVYFYETLGDRWLRKGSRAKAIENYRIALKNAERNDVMFKLSEKIGDVYRDMNMLDASDSFYVKATQISDIPSDDMFRVYKKQIGNLIARDLFEQALTLVSKLEIDRRFGQFSTEVMYIKGTVHLALGDKGNAVFVFETALRNRGISILSDTIIIRGAYQPAAPSGNESERGEDGDREAADTARVDLVGMSEENVKLLRDEIISDIMFELAKIYYATGQFRRAVMVCNIIIQHNPEYHNIAECKRIVEAVQGLETLRAQRREYQGSATEFLYKEAEYFLIEMNNPDTSLKILTQIVESPEIKQDTLLYQKTLFAISYIHINQKEDSIRGKEFLRAVIEVDAYSVYAKEAARRLGLEPRLSVADSLDIDLARAQRLVLDGEFEKAREEYFSIIARYDSQVLPNVNYAYAGLAHLFERVFFNNDSAYFFYRSIVEAANADSLLLHFAGERIKNKETLELLLEPE